MRWLILPALLSLAACSRESTPPTPAPSNGGRGAATLPAGSRPSPAVREPSYDDAILWLKTVPHFSFVLDEAGVHAEGEMTREHVAAEQVQFRANGEEWRANVLPQGLVWKKRAGENWVDTTPPPFAGRLYQRVTLGLDPQKTEGAPQLVTREGGTAVFRFTNANTGDVHQVSVRGDGSVARIAIGNSVELKIN